MQLPLMLKLLADSFGIFKLPPSHPFPDWLVDTALYFVARTEDEFSVMCPEDVIPAQLTYSGGWRCLRVHSHLAFDEIGVAARLAKPLADAGLSIFVVSTHDRDYVFVAESDLSKALSIYDHFGFFIILDTR